MKYLFKSSYALLLVLLLPFTVFVNPIEKVDIFDSANNHLMFINFKYDNSGNNISRSIYMSDSTFIREVLIDGNKEYSINFNGDTVLTSNYNKDGSSTNLSVLDQFNLDMLGGQISYSENSSNNFEVKQKGSVINKISYETNSDKTRINILNSSGELQFYATINDTTSILTRNKRNTFSAPSLKMNNNQIKIHFNLSKASIINCELVSLSGRRIAKLISKKAVKGTQNEIIRISEKMPALSSGVYFLTLSINGKRVLNEKILMQNSGRGF